MKLLAVEGTPSYIPALKSCFRKKFTLENLTTISTQMKVESVQYPGLLGNRALQTGILVALH